MEGSRPMREFTREVARRYLLGSQGLWPGKRWRGKGGAAQALEALGAVQMDPVSLIHRSHDLVLLSRVEGYQPEHLDQLLYTDRRFFDYGGHLDMYPMAELPYWRQHMARRGQQLRAEGWLDDHQAVIDRVLNEITERGPLFSRELIGSRQVDSYRGRKDSGVALYFLWLTGVTMTHSRKGFERRYDLRGRVAPENLGWQADEAAVNAWSEAAALHRAGLCTAVGWAQGVRYRRLGDSWPAAERVRAVGRLVRCGAAAEIRLTGLPGSFLVPGEALPQLEELARGGLPAEWTPLPGQATRVMTFLSPLDNLVHDRRRTLHLFDFDYLWEIYTKAERRRYGPYTLPILYGDRLVGRIDLRLDRSKRRLEVNGVWWENQKEATGKRFQAAFGECLEAFAAAHGARDVGPAGV